jgi:hypothetical protein
MTMRPAGPFGLQRQPSWADSAQRPPPGTWCNACYGLRWWTERQRLAGWRCMTCHSPAHLVPERAEIVGPPESGAALAQSAAPRCGSSQSPR